MRLMKQGRMIGALMLFMTLSAFAEESKPLTDWRGCAVSEADFQKTVLPAGVEWFFVGHPANSFKTEKLFSNSGPTAYYIHFPLAPLPENAKPLLLLNGVPEKSVVLLAGKPLTQVNQRQKGGDEFSVERWYQLPVESLRTGEKDLNRIEIWVPSIRKSADASITPLSTIVMNDPDVLAERERQRKLRQPYLHEVEEAEDPYVARHW